MAQFNDAIQLETGRKVSPYLKTLPTDKTGAEQVAGMMNRGNNFYLGSTTAGQPIGHVTALNSVSVRTFQKYQGTYTIKLFIR